MKICSEIRIELTVGSYVEAADHQRYLEDLLQVVRKDYPGASLVMRERRERRAQPTAVAAPPRRASVADRYTD